MSAEIRQDKAREIQFFGRHAEGDDYDVFSEESNRKIADCFVQLTGLVPGTLIADLGCGSGVFSGLLQGIGFNCIGLDLSEALLHRGRDRFGDLDFVAGDVELLPFADASLDGILLSGIVHHLPAPSACAEEVFRVLKPGGSFMAFDPNRLNPFMYLYRDKSSPFYSSEGVTENERPVLPGPTASIFRDKGFDVGTHYLSDLHYRYIASGRLRWALPIYNFVSEVLFRPSFMAQFGAFVITYGRKA
tara:strand:- start:593 stop:1330 length:738 start_codon:yes stop_codon:yes gene_type:complete